MQALEPTGAAAVEGFRLSPQQRALWALRQGVCCRARLQGEVDTARLERSLQACVDRHEILRTDFRQLPGMNEPLQVIREQGGFSLQLHDLEAVPEPERGALADRLLAAEAARPYDLEDGPLLHASLLRFSAREHLLQIRLPALCADPAGARNLLRELASGPDGEPLQYADAAEWLNSLLALPEAAPGRELWARQDAAAVAAVRLAGRREPDSGAGFLPGFLRWSFGGELTAALAALAGRLGTSLEVLLLACWKVLLHRRTGRPELTVGVLFEGRRSEELVGAVGLFARFLPLRDRILEGEPFAAAVAAVRRTFDEACLYQEYFSWESFAGGGLAGFPFAFDFESWPETGFGEGPVFALAGRSFVLDRSEVRLSLLHLGADLQAELQYDARLFDEEEVAALRDQLQTLLAEAVRRPAAAAGDFELLGGAARRRLLVDFNRAPQERRADRPVHRLFEEQARRTPDHTAVVCAGERLTYAELDRRADALARRLVRRGVRPETRVALLMPRSVDTVTALLAVLKAGGAYLPLDPDLPPERVAWILEDSGALLALTGVDGEGEEEEAPGLAAAPVDMEALAYVIYTSGSTGRPKGVMVSHRGLANYLVWCAGAYGVARGAGTLVHSPLGFDLTVTGLLAPLIAGGQATLLDGVEPLAAALAEADDLSLVKLTPAHLEVLAGLLPPESLAGRARTLVIGGEALRAESLAAWRRHAPATRLINEYGPTETVVGCCAWEVPSDAPEAGAVPIGRPVAGARLYVVSPRGVAVPPGVAGELLIGGDGVARGYLGRPDLTAASFVPDPFGDTPGGRLYRSGDLAVHGPGGRLEFLGRIDHQVKIRGFRVELGEIESVLAEHPAVREAVVLVDSRETGAPRLAAYVVAAGAASAVPAAAELRAHCARRLPAPLLPGLFVPVRSLPLTANGKVDREALARLRPEEAVGPWAAPRTPAERRIAEIWGELLRVDRVGLHDNFFELGGDSILSIQAVARMSRQGLHVTSRDLFAHQTVAELAAFAAAAAPGEPEPPEPEGPVPLTPIQRWFFALDLADPHHFNQALLLKAPASLDSGCLAAAVEHLARRHDALRLRFTRGAGGWRQEVAAEPGPALSVRIDLTALPEGDRPAALAAAAAQVQAGLDLEHGPLLRVARLDLGAARPCRLLLVVHHLAVDAVSWWALLDDLRTAYEQLAAGRPVALPPPSSSFRRWARALADSAAPDVRPGRSDRANTVASLRTVTVELAPEETRSLLLDVPRLHRAQPHEVLLAAAGRALAGWTGAPAVRLDVEGHGRDEPGDGLDLSRTVAWCTRIVPVVLAFDPGGDPRGVLRAVKEQVRAARGAPAGDLPPAEVSFNFLGQLDQALPGGGLLAPAPESAGPLRSPRQIRPYRLEIEGAVLGGRLRLELGYSAALHEAAAMERLADACRSVLRELIALPAPGAFIPSDFPSAGLDPAALDRLLRDAPEVEDVYPLSPVQQGMLFHSLLEPEQGVYAECLTGLLHGALDPAAFAGAWSRIVDRHAVLRTSFRVDGSGRPLQLVHRGIGLPVEWLPAGSGSFEDLVGAERRRGFDVGVPPLQRLILRPEGDGAWRFLWVHHHLLLDGWSTALVLAEVLTAYRELRAGREPELPPPRPYRDYIAWLERRDLRAAEEFWRGALAGVKGPTLLTAGRPAEGGEAPRFAQHQVRLPAGTSRDLEGFARRELLTPGLLVQAAWALLLGRYLHESEVIFGVTLAGRPPELAGVEEMVGVFINTVPVRVRIPDGGPLRRWLGALQEEQVELRARGDAPLVEIRRWSGIPADQPLFDSLVVFENYPAGDLLALAAEGGLRLDELTPVETTSYAATLVVTPGPGLALRLLYDGRYLDPAAADRLLGHLAALLDGMLRAPGESPEQLPLLTAAERGQLLGEWNRAAAPVPAELLHEAVAAVARRAPDALAVEMGEERLTYGELDGRAGLLAAHLRSLGVALDAPVGLCMERSLDMAVGVLGILKAGAAYVPLDPSYPRERLAYLLADSAAGVLLTQSALAGRLPETRARVVRLDTDWPGIARRRGAAPSEAGSPGSLAYLIYTSGSTGRPKGVAMPHRALSNLIAWQLRAWEGERPARILQFAAPGFDVSFQEMFATWCSGGSLVLAPEAARKDPSALLRLIGEAGIERLFVPFVALQSLAEAALAAGGAPPCLREVITAGEQLRITPAVAALFRGGGRSLHNQYGPSESHVVTAWRLDGPPEAWPQLPPIGLPVANVGIHLVDPALRLVPVGVTGEVCIGGIALARGYLGRPEMTAERFVPDPWGEPGARLYRTGDLARRRSDGAVEFLGRADHQLKVRGFRIEPGEIEALLGRHPDVRQAAVVARADAAGGPARIVAYVVAAEGRSVASGRLRSFLAEELPAPLLPSAFVVLDALPLTASGKVDRLSLPAPGRARPGLEEEYVAPRTPVEELVAGLWAEVLGFDRVGIRDNFFALGGHSLLATRLASRLRACFAAEVPLRALFESPTVAALAGRVEEALRADRGEPAPPLERVPRGSGEAGLPLSFAQQRLWFLDQLEPGSAAYNLSVAVRVEGRLQVAALRRCFAEIVRRHEILRTTFVAVDDEAFQVVHPPFEPELPVCDLRAVPAGPAAAEVRRRGSEWAGRPFALGSLPLLRSALLRTGEREHVLLLTLHHIIADAWSFDLLLRELTALYPALLRGGAPPLPELSVQYADFAVWQRTWLRGEALAAQLDHWRRALAGATPLLLPTGRPRPAADPSRGGRLAWPIPEELTRQLRDLGRREGATLFITLLAAFVALLHREAERDDVVLGADVANRTRGEVEGLIGFFVNMLVIRVDAAGNPPFRQLLARVREAALGAYAHQDVPFDKLVEELRPERAKGQAPFFQVVFNFDNTADPGGEGDGPEGLTLRFEEPDEVRVRFELALQMRERAGGLHATWLYSAELFEAARIERLHGRFEALLRGVAADPDARIGHLDLASDAERRERESRERGRDEGKHKKLREIRSRLPRG